MPFPSSEEGLGSLLVIQPHLSWPGGAVRGGAPPGDKQQHQGEDRDPLRLQETPGDSRRPSGPQLISSSGMTAVQDWLLILGGPGPTGHLLLHQTKD